MIATFHTLVLEATILTLELLQWLRTSSENGGESFLGLSLS
jgi:hypothetical protein